MDSFRALQTQQRSMRRSSGPPRSQSRNIDDADHGASWCDRIVDAAAMVGRIDGRS
jgi:hypothetical protein